MVAKKDNHKFDCLILGLLYNDSLAQIFRQELIRFIGQIDKLNYHFRYLFVIRDVGRGKWKVERNDTKISNSCTFMNLPSKCSVCSFCKTKEASHVWDREQKGKTGPLKAIIEK